MILMMMINDTINHKRYERYYFHHYDASMIYVLCLTAKVVLLLFSSFGDEKNKSSINMMTAVNEEIWFVYKNNSQSIKMFKVTKNMLCCWWQFLGSTLGTCYVYGVYASVFEIISQIVILSVCNDGVVGVLIFSNKFSL